MIPLAITPDIDKAPWFNTKEECPKEMGLITRIGRLTRGTKGGKSTVSVLIKLPDGREFIAETTLALLRTAMVAFEAAESRDSERSPA